MAEMYNIKIPGGNYTIIEYQRKSPNRKKFIPAGELINTDGYRVDGNVYNAKYIVTEEWDENNTVVRRVYGTPPKGAYIPARFLQSVYDENADNIALASRKYPGKEFTKAIHGLLNNPYFQQQPFQQQPMQVPQMQNALTNEEIQRLRSLRPTTSLNLSVDQEEVLRAMCTHKDNGREVVQLLQDGSGDAYCPICGKRWKPEQLSQEDLQALVDQLICQIHFRVKRSC